MRPLRTTLICLPAILAVAATAAAQDKARAVLGHVVDDAGRRLAKAAVTFLPSEAHGIDLLAGWTQAPRARTTTTDERGVFRFPRATGPGCLVVEHEVGLGAVLYRIDPGEPRELRAIPLAEVQLPAGSPEILAVHVEAPDGSRFDLGARIGARVRLPAGDYRLLVQSKAGMQEHRVRLRSGERRTLTEPRGDLRSVRLWKGFRGHVSLRGWPKLALPIQGRRVRVAKNVRRLQIWQELDGLFLRHDVWLGEGELLPAPKPSRTVKLRVLDDKGKPLPDAYVFGCQGNASRLEVRSVKRTDAAGHGRCVRLEEGHVVVFAQGFQLLRVAVTDTGQELRLQRGRSVWLRLEDSRGNAIRHALVTLDVPKSPFEQRRRLTNSRGEVRFFGLTPGEVDVRILETQYLQVPMSLEVPAVSHRRPNPIRCKLGESFRGVVVFPNGKPAAGAIVEVRDPSDTTGLRPCVVFTGADGRFVLAGLPAGIPLALSASLKNGSTSWISKTRSRQPGDGHKIQLRPEDPQPPGKH